MKNKALLLLLGVFLTSQAAYSEIKNTKAQTPKKIEVKQVQNEETEKSTVEEVSKVQKNYEEVESATPETLTSSPENNEIKAEDIRSGAPARTEKKKKPVKTKRQKAEEKSRKNTEKDLSADEKMRLQLIRMERMLKSLEGK